jgi:hypothetical protein
MVMSLKNGVIGSPRMFVLTSDSALTAPAECLETAAMVIPESTPCP